jgi:lipoprotein-releasing system permease protein
MLSWKVAVRFLTSSKLQTVLIVLGIAIGVSVQIFVGTLIGSLQTGLVDSTIGNQPQIVILPDGTQGNIDQWEERVSDLETVNGISEASVAADESAFASWSNSTYPVLVRGLDFEMAEGIYGFGDSLYQGSLPDSMNEIIMGKELAEELGANVGDPIEIITAENRFQSMNITGLYDLGVTSINELWLPTTLSTSQQLFDLDDDMTSIEAQVFDVFAADTIAEDVSDRPLFQDLKVENWKDLNRELLSGLQGQSISSIMIQVFVLAAVVIAIASILAIKVVQKSREIGILKAMGIKDRDASYIFLFQGFILGVIGSILGVLLGLFLTYGFSVGVTNADGTALIDITFDPWFIIISGTIAVVAATLASLLPARASSKLSPIEVIRNG